MVNLEGLSKYIDSTQLTSDLDGSLHYDHAQWIDIRLVSKNQFKNCMMDVDLDIYNRRCWCLIENEIKF